MRDCDIDCETMTCRRCRVPIAACEVHRNCRRIGLGDRVASALASVGITKERVSRLLGRPCGCPKRQAALNRIGERIGL